jgi:cell division protein FtsL
MTQSAQSVETGALPRLREEKENSLGIKYPAYIVFAVILMMVALVYVWSHIRMTELEYSIAAELHAQQQKLEEQKKLKLEYAMLKSPQRIESIVKSKLQMSYPDNDQVIVLKRSGE